jgi:hypothetical protein
MKNSLPVIATVCALASLLSGCGKDAFLYYRNTPLKSDSSYQIKEMSGTNAVDVVWVIDNSASMETFQNQVMANANIFMQDFITQGLEWKMGLISTDQTEAPYAGFANSVKLDYTVANPAQVFASAVGRLGLDGDTTERTFNPILRALRNDPTFERSGAPIVFIMVTDAPEQSNVSATSFINQLTTLTGSTRQMYAYGVFASSDQNCPSDEGSWSYVGSPYEGFIKAARGGRVYPLCRDFGATLATIGHDIVTRVSHPTIFLNMRPNTNTLRILYHGEELPAGETAQGGFWKYDYSLNAIVFNSLSFSVDDNDAVQIIFDEDTGV